LYTSITFILKVCINFPKYALVAISEPRVNAVGDVGLPESGLDAVLEFLSLNLQIVLEFEGKFSGCGLAEQRQNAWPNLNLREQHSSSFP
jgi:hypothetical protein